MELRLEGGHQRDARQAFAEGADGRQIDGIVRRRGRQELFQGQQYAIVNRKRAAVSWSGMHGLEGHRIHRNAAGAEPLDGFAIIPHALEPSAAQHLLGGHLQNLVLQRRGAQVRNQEVHLTP